MEGLCGQATCGHAFIQQAKNSSKIHIELTLAPLEAASSGGLINVFEYADMITGLSSGLIFSVLHIIGPQNLGTIMTLSSVTTRNTAFSVGAACGFGHSFGMVFIAILILSARSVFTVDAEAWEHYGNYLIGASLVVCAVYFMMQETKFLVQREDGSYDVQPCDCHGSHGSHDTTAPEKAAGSRPASTLAGEGEKACHSPVSEQHDAALHHENKDSRNALGALIGMLQGTCCPLVMVGVSFVATLHGSGIAVFLITFMTLTALGTAFLAMSWAWATNAGLCGGLSSKIAYRVSCSCTLALGIGWVIANHFDALDNLNYAEAAERANLDAMKTA